MINKYLLALLLVVCYGCTQEELTPQDGSKSQENKVSFAGVNGANTTTRTLLGNPQDGTPTPIYWAADDALGVFTTTPGATANNAKATITAGTGTIQGQFASLAVTMAATDNVFYLYYPYQKSAALTSTPTTDTPLTYQTEEHPHLLGLLPQVQTQPEPNVLTHFATYGYSVATSASTPLGSEVTFSMKHIMAYLELSLYTTTTVLDGYKIEQIEIQTVNIAHALSGTFTTTFEGECTPQTGGLPQVTLQIATPKPLTTGASNKQTFMATLLPINLSGENIRITVKMVDASGGTHKTYRRVFGGSNLTSGSLNKISADMTSWEATTVAEAAKTETFLAQTAKLATLADTWAALPANTATYNTPALRAWLVAMYIRKFGGYTSPNWAFVAGAINASFVDYVAAQDAPVYNYYNTTTAVPGMEKGMDMGLGLKRTVDLRHMMATLSCHLKLNSTSSYFTENAGWAGDLGTFVTHLKGVLATGTETEYYNLAYAKMGRDGTSYSLDDLIGDVDALNIATLVIAQGKTITQAMEYYYTNPEGYMKRFTSFVASFGTDAAFKAQVKSYVSGTAEQKNGITNGYYDFILALRAQE